LKAILQKRIYGFSFPFNKEIFIISPEDLILSKLSAYKEIKSDQRLEDARSILEISRPDLNYIKNWAKKQSTIKILEEILKMNTR
jgi:response regulator of citrate/malate metabolism